MALSTVQSGYSDSRATGASAGNAQYDPGEEYWTLDECKQAYLDYLGSKTEEITEQQNARRYRHGVQWTSKQIQILNSRGQPVITYNRIGRKIDSIVGLVDRFKQDPKAFPNTNRDEAGAELATASVRFVFEEGLKKKHLPFVTDQCAVDGYGGIELKLVDDGKGGIDVGFSAVLNDDFFYDPTSILYDFSDANYMGVGKWLFLAQAQRMFPQFASLLASAVEYGSSLSTNPDRERKWFDTSGGRKRIRLVEVWYKHQDGWCWSIFTGSMKLMEGKSYFQNDKGEDICRYRMFSCAIDQDGDRYGFVRNQIGPQDEINQRRSKALHELNSRRIKAEDGAFADIEVARKEAVRPDGVVLFQKDFVMEFDDATRLQNMEGNLKFLEEAKNEIENFGPNPALIGQGLEYKSGRAISLLQQAGITELGPFIINYRFWKLDLYRCIWCIIKKYWTGERFIRISDDDNIAQLVPLNQVEVDPSTGLVKIINAIGQLDVDIIMDEGPDEVNMMADAYDTLGAMATQGANVPPQILIELAPLAGSKKKKLLSYMEPDPQEAQLKQQAVMIQLQQGMEDLRKTMSEVALNIAKAQEIGQGGAHGMIEREFDRRANLEAEAVHQSGETQKHEQKMTEIAAQDLTKHADHRRRLSEMATKAANGGAK